MKGWDYIWQHPEIVLGWLLVVIGIITGAVWSVKVLTAKFKYTYEKEKDAAWRKEHKKRLDIQKTCDELLEIAQRATNNHKIALMTLVGSERAKRNQQKTD